MHSSAIDGTDAEPPPGTTSPILAQLESLRELIWKRRPILGEIMQKHGDKTLHRYSQDFLDVNKSPMLDARKGELIDVVRELLTQRLGADVAAKVARQLNKYPLVSTTDHHSICQHPFFLNANIISAIPYIQKNDPDLTYLVVFSFASVSVNNASAYARGLLFHGDVDGTGNMIRLPVLPDKTKMSVVYGMSPYNREDLIKSERELQKRAQAGEMSEERVKKIIDFMEEYIDTPEILEALDLSSQITKINYRMWPKLFHAPRSVGAAGVNGPVPDLIYLEIETIITELLLKLHCVNTTSLIYRFIFDITYRPLILKYFNNIPGAFSLEKQWGTYLFWALDESLHRVQLSLEGDFIVSSKGTYKIPLTPEGIIEALSTKKIFPSMLLCYLIVSLYYGMKCLGGFCQVNDLTRTKEAWSDMLKELGEEAERIALEPVQTKELGGDGMVLPYFKTATGDYTPATGIDMFIDAGETSFEKYARRAQDVTLSEMMAPMLPEMYTVLYTAEERDMNLASIKPEAIFREVKLNEKLVH